ncbi:MAG: hypothetical protein AAFP22_13915, partial [Planctomycetota bacterium]
LRGPFGLFGSAETPTQEADQGATREIPELGDGMVRAYTSARDIPAYTKISRDDLWNKNQAMLTFVDLPEEYVEENGILASLGDITGRVMSRNKRAGYVFTESDFLPKGTRPGIAGGTPPGMRSLRIPVELVRGIIGLNPGDRFDLVAARRLEPGAVVKGPSASKNDPAFVGLYANLANRRGSKARPAPRGPESRVDVIVSGGVVVEAIDTREVPVSSAGLVGGLSTRTKPVQEMVIALAPEEVAPLMAAIRLEDEITCLARSGRPDDPADSVTPGLLPESMRDAQPADDDRGAATGPTGMPNGYAAGEFTVVETLVGGERALTAVPKGSSDDSR